MSWLAAWVPNVNVFVVVSALWSHWLQWVYSHSIHIVSLSPLYYSVHHHHLQTAIEKNTSNHLWSQQASMPVVIFYLINLLYLWMSWSSSSPSPPGPALGPHIYTNQPGINENLEISHHLLYISNVKVMPRDPDCGYFKSFDRKKYFSISLGLLWTGYEQIHQLFESNSLKRLENKVLL